MNLLTPSFYFLCPHEKCILTSQNYEQTTEVILLLYHNMFYDNIGKMFTLCIALHFFFLHIVCVCFV